MNIFADYPTGIHENPFNIDAKGNYFAYLTNRECCLSYLSEKLEDFDYNNNNLYNAMPMGYTSLWVFERVFVVNSEEVWKKFKNEKNTQILFYIEDNGENKLISQSQLLEIVHWNFKEQNDSIEEQLLNWCRLLKNAKEELQCTKISAVGAILLKEYNWH